MFVNQKAQEISYALVRIAAYIRRQELRQRFEKSGFQLLEEAGRGDFEASLKTLGVIENLINIGKAIYEVEPVNAKVIIGEVSHLRSVLQEMTGLSGISQIEEIFSKPPAVIQNKERSEVTVSEGSGSDQISRIHDSALPNRDNPAMRQGTDSVQYSPNGNGIGSAIRQSAILDKIRQSLNRQTPLKDLLAAFPEVSERTMRYDLQKLCSQGLIRRVGNGGPGSYYSLL